LDVTATQTSKWLCHLWKLGFLGFFVILSSGPGLVESS